ncbi:MAG: rhodanese-like domain-containing protein [Vallitaleaceae bacterium]|nr:rhodanese-like domain-containing protein [Vallitaleaceae bacterium]
MIREDYNEITYATLKRCLLNAQYVLVDIRSVYEYRQYHIKGAISIPEHELFTRMKELKKDKTYIFICQKGKNSKDVAITLAGYGYKTINLKDGMNGISKCGE